MYISVNLETVHLFWFLLMSLILTFWFTLIRHRLAHWLMTVYKTVDYISKDIPSIWVTKIPKLFFAKNTLTFSAFLNTRPAFSTKHVIWKKIQRQGKVCSKEFRGCFPGRSSNSCSGWNILDTVLSPNDKTLF